MVCVVNEFWETEGYSISQVVQHLFVSPVQLEELKNENVPDKRCFLFQTDYRLYEMNFL